MRKLLLAIVVGACVLIQPVGLLKATPGGTPELHDLKLRHKAERNALKLKKKYWSQSVKQQGIPKAQLVQMKHQIEREERELRERQKDELQDLRDRQRIVKESQSQF